MKKLFAYMVAAVTLTMASSAMAQGNQFCHATSKANQKVHYITKVFEVPDVAAEWALYERYLRDNFKDETDVKCETEDLKYRHLNLLQRIREDLIKKWTHGEKTDIQPNEVWKQGEERVQGIQFDLGSMKRLGMYCRHEEPNGKNSYFARYSRVFSIDRVPSEKELGEEATRFASHNGGNKARRHCDLYMSVALAQEDQQESIQGREKSTQQAIAEQNAPPIRCRGADVCYTFGPKSQYKIEMVNDWVTSLPITPSSPAELARIKREEAKQKQEEEKQQREAARKAREEEARQKAEAMRLKKAEAAHQAEEARKHREAEALRAQTEWAQARLDATMQQTLYESVNEGVLQEKQNAVAAKYSESKAAPKDDSADCKMVPLQRYSVAESRKSPTSREAALAKMMEGVPKVCPGGSYRSVGAPTCHSWGDVHVSEKGKVTTKGRIWWCKAEVTCEQEHRQCKAGPSKGASKQ